MRRVLGVLLITAGVSTMGVGLLAGQASAHHPIISGTTSCRPSESAPWTVQWTVTNSEEEPERSMTELSTSLSNGSWTSNPSPDAVAPSGSASGTSEHPSSSSSATLTYAAAWTYDGKTITADRSFTVQRPAVCQGATSSTTSSTVQHSSSSTTSTTAHESTTTSTTAGSSSTSTSSSSTSSSTTTSSVAAGGPTTTSTSTTTTLVASGGPRPTTTTLVASAGPTSPAPSQARAVTTQTLPATGSGAGKLAMLGAFMILLGCVTLLLGQRPVDARPVG